MGLFHHQLFIRLKRECHYSTSITGTKGDTMPCDTRGTFVVQKKKKKTQACTVPNNRCLQKKQWNRFFYLLIHLATNSTPLTVMYFDFLPP